MDQRPWVIAAVCLLEVIFRLLSGHVLVDPLLFTLAARLAEAALILVLAFRSCGIHSASIAGEISIGLGASIIFGMIVLAIELILRVLIGKGLLGMLLEIGPLDRWPVFFAAGCIVGPFVEELFFRGLLYSWLRQRLRAESCIILTSILFASMHGRISLVQLSGGVIFAGLYEWRRNIWAPFTVHALANLSIWILPYIYPIM